MRSTARRRPAEESDPLRRAAVRAGLAGLEPQDVARVGVTVPSSGRSAVAPGDEPFTPRRALDDALALLSTAAGVAIVAAAAVVPLGLLAQLLVLGWRALRRQRREAALRQLPSVV